MNEKIKAKCKLSEGSSRQTLTVNQKITKDTDFALNSLHFKNLKI